MTERDRPSEDEIEITPAMLTAGVDALADAWVESQLSAYEEIAAAVFRRMCAAKEAQRSGSPVPPSTPRPLFCP
jgi:hypothetical protein